VISKCIPNRLLIPIRPEVHSDQKKTALDTEDAQRKYDCNFLECELDEEYPHLIPTPPVPLVGVVAADAHYVNMEGKPNVY
jgi:hypothetical protein